MTPTSFPIRALSAFFLLVAATFLAAPAAAAAVANDELARYADQLFSQAYSAGEPGAAVLVARDGHVLLRKGYGLANLELGVPIQPDMVFEIGSLTKQFTAAAILLLQERGKLSVDDEVTKYLPDYPTHGQKITLDHLLTHRSGIPNYTSLPEWPPRMREDLTVQQLVDLFKDKPLDFNPGERMSYSNSAYVLLGAVIEKVSGKSYEDFVEQEIFAPLGMKRSRYGRQNEVVPGRVTGYARAGDGYEVAEYISMTQPYAAGALLSTVDDLALWAEGLYGGKLLQKASLVRMTTPPRLSSGKLTQYAYGVGVADEDGTRIVEHGGGIPGFASFLLTVPDRRLVVVVLANSLGRPPSPDDLTYRVGWKALGKPIEERKAMVLDPAALGEYVGVYRGEEFAATLLLEGDKLFFRSRGEKREIQAASRDDFFDPASNRRVHFLRDTRGKITGLELRFRFGAADATALKTGEPLPAERQAVQVNPGLYDGYAGVYELAALAPGFLLTVTREGNHLMTQAMDQPKVEVFPASESRFFFREEDAEIEFQRGGDGRATGLTLYQDGQALPGKKIR